MITYKPHGFMIARMSWAVCIVLILCALMLIVPMSAQAVQHAEGYTYHNHGSVYCIRAQEVTFTTAQIASSVDAGTLLDAIVAQSQMQVVVLNTLEPYTGSFSCADIGLLSFARFLGSQRDYYITIQVNPLDPSQGAVTLKITVVPATPVDPPPDIIIKPVKPTGPDDEDKPIVPPPVGEETAQEGLEPGVSHGEVQPTSNDSREKPAKVVKQSSRNDSSTTVIDHTADENDSQYNGLPDENLTFENWFAICVYGVTIAGVVPAVLVNAITDVRVLRWFYGSRRQMRMGH